MIRGLFNNFLSIPEYQDAKKAWHVTLERSEFFWYELVVNPPEAHDTKQLIANYLKKLRSDVEATLEKRFIYFYISRKKVRFDTTRPTKYSLFGFGNNLEINIIIEGKKRQRICLPVPRVEINGKFIKLNVSTDDRFMYLQGPTFSKTLSIHDFLRLNQISLGITSEVLYVGITKDPAKRTLNREHRGYADAIYFSPTSENDIFLTVNTFKVMSDTTMGSGFLRVVSANSMSDEIPADDEGAVIENALIHYFDTRAQQTDKKNSLPKSKNLLDLTLGAKKIKSVSIHMELENPSEYDALGSRCITPNTSHSFSWELLDGKPELVKFNSEREMAIFRDVGQSS